MTEISRPWSGIVTGDAGPYTDDNWMDVWDSLMTLVTPTPNDFGGVFKDQLSELAPISAGVSPLTIGTGRAIVNGSWYESDAAETIAIATPGANPRIDRIVLRKDWALQTIRLTRIAGVEGASPAVPALVQTDGVTWDVPIAQVRIPVGGSFDYIRDERLLIGQYQPVGIQDQQTYFDDEFFDGGDWVDLESRRMWQAAISAGAGNLLRVLNISYPGTWLALPTIVIAGRIDDPRIDNVTTGEKIELDLNIPNGRTVTIDLTEGVKTVTDDLGTNLIGAVSSDSDLATFHIAPDPEATGGINAMRLRGSNASGNTSVQIRYFVRYFGV